MILKFVSNLRMQKFVTHMFVEDNDDVTNNVVDLVNINMCIYTSIIKYIYIYTTYHSKTLG